MAGSPDDRGAATRLRGRTHFRKGAGGHSLWSAGYLHSSQLLPGGYVVSTDRDLCRVAFGRASILAVASPKLLRKAPGVGDPADLAERVARYPTLLADVANASARGALVLDPYLLRWRPTTVGRS